jgi:hypothetical protein
MITKAIKEIMQYVYSHCDENLRACVDYDEFKTEMKSNISRKEFSQSIHFMRYDGYFSDKVNEFTHGSTEEKLHFRVLILPRLIREVENPVN